MSDPKEQIREILKKAYQIEVDGYTFYSMAADKSTKPAVQELFDKLAKDETEHKSYLREVMRRYEAEGTGAFTVDRRDPQVKAFADAIFTQKFKEQAHGAAFELGALSVGMQLETNAIAHFSAAAEAASEREVQEFYRFLAQWERGHFEALQALHSLVRADFWEQGGFAPF